MTAASSDGPEMAKHHTNKTQRRALADRMKNPRTIRCSSSSCATCGSPASTSLPAHHVHRQTNARAQPDASHRPCQPRLLRQAGRPHRRLSGHRLRPEKSTLLLLRQRRQRRPHRNTRASRQPHAGETGSRLADVPRIPVRRLFRRRHIGEKLSLILAAEDHILGLEDGRRRYINEVTGLSQAFAIAIPHEEALDVKDEVAFFQAVKARLAKFDSTGSGRTDEEMETAIRQVIDQALVSEQVVDILRRRRPEKARHLHPLRRVPARNSRHGAQKPGALEVLQETAQR